MHGQRLERFVPFLMVLPSIILIAIFVYGFIGWTGYVSVSNWNTFVPDFSFAGLKNYAYLFRDFRFQSDLRNTLFFSVLFIGSCLVIGLALAVLVDQKLRGAAFFRNVFLFPMALSFVVTGVVWQWILNPSTGVNLWLRALGVENPPLWYVSTQVVPKIALGRIQFGLPLAILAVVIAGVWQQSGFAMATYLAGLQSIPEEVREAASVDGATEWQKFRYVILPMLRPMTITIVIMLAHVSLKTFDLVYAMTGPGAGYVTDVPGVYMFETSFRGNHYANGAGIAMVMLILSAAVTVPYLLGRGRRDLGDVDIN
ncbi:glucose/mannose transport system permease protein [Symbiobacterium terraclitae]|uniref:Glucose/mannose transport system permease protein n=1 Tax=Symbiobacterium terraclitae TaxID=557451 RepID=A0ABS4JVR9_9FIRM|nr:sugar ABC transporter permease [Symbiobacterium terraclitae]MBP2019647.1 glucose/mannose transport system permease protein [Symbiobacterium terraclitae]